MKEFIWNIQCMLYAKKNAKEIEQCRTEYFWYKYLVQTTIKNFFKQFKFWGKDTIPF